MKMSNDSVNNVVLFKSVSDEKNTPQKDVYFETFEKAGYNVTIIPVIDFEFINLNELMLKLKRHDHYEGIIFSSPRCVKAFELAIGNEKNLICLWRNHKNFVVGEGTQKSAERLGLVVFGQEAGNGEALAKIISEGVYTKPFLYPVGSLALKNLKSILINKNIEVDEVMTYKTKPHEQLEENISMLIPKVSHHRSTIFVYFSPSGVSYSIPLLKNLKFDLNVIKFVAIGPVTEQELIKNGCIVSKTAAKPNHENLLKVISTLKE